MNLEFRFQSRLIQPSESIDSRQEITLGRIKSHFRNILNNFLEMVFLTNALGWVLTKNEIGDSGTPRPRIILYGALYTFSHCNLVSN